MDDLEKRIFEAFSTVIDLARDGKKAERVGRALDEYRKEQQKVEERHLMLMARREREANDAAAQAEQKRIDAEKAEEEAKARAEVMIRNAENVRATASKLREEADERIRRAEVLAQEAAKESREATRVRNDLKAWEERLAKKEADLETRAERLKAALA